MTVNQAFRAGDLPFQALQYFADALKCADCNGSGELHKSHPKAIPAGGFQTGAAFPSITGGTSGHVTAEKYKCICGGCKGTGIKR